MKKCPNCGSRKIEVYPIPFKRKIGVRCMNCGYINTDQQLRINQYKPVENGEDDKGSEESD